jgi:predicted anti-sigma-YlaC factor YlaD
VEQPAFRRLLQNIADTEDEEIGCTECFDLIAEYVDLEVAGNGGERRLHQLQQHLRECSVCREEYEILRDLVRLEDDAQRPPADELTP